MFGDYLNPAARSMEQPQLMLHSIPIQQPDLIDHQAGAVPCTLAIDAIRRDLAAQRKMLDDVHKNMEQLLSGCLALSREFEDIKKEFRPRELKDAFSAYVTNNRFCEVIADIKLEMKQTKVFDNSSNIGVNSSDLKAMGQTLGEAVNSVSTQQNNFVMAAIDSMKSNMLVMREELMTKLSGFRQELYQKLESPALRADKVKSVLEARIEELRKEFDQKIGVVHDVFEQTALKAGHLAIAASECTQEQKQVLYKTLKAKEQSLQKGLTSEPILSTRKGPTSQPVSIPVFSGSLLPPPVTEEFTINLLCPSGSKLGLNLHSCQDPKMLLIQAIRDGIVKDWNATCSPAKQIKVGDHIVAINGTRAEAKELITLINETVHNCTGDLKLTISRSRSKQTFRSPLFAERTPPAYQASVHSERKSLPASLEDVQAESRQAAMRMDQEYFLKTLNTNGAVPSFNPCFMQL